MKTTDATDDTEASRKYTYMTCIYLKKKLKPGEGIF